MGTCSINQIKSLKIDLNGSFQSIFYHIKRGRVERLYLFFLLKTSRFRENIVEKTLQKVAKNTKKTAKKGSKTAKKPSKIAEKRPKIG